MKRYDKSRTFKLVENKYEEHLHRHFAPEFKQLNLLSNKNFIDAENNKILYIKSVTFSGLATNICDRRCLHSMETRT